MARGCSRWTWLPESNPAGILCHRAPQSDRGMQQPRHVGKAGEDSTPLVLPHISPSRGEIS
jgi:hypothetical protein